MLSLTTPHQYRIQSVSRKEDHNVVTHHTTPIQNTVRQSKRRPQCCHSPHYTNTEYSPSVEKTTTVLSLTTPHQYRIQSVSRKDDYSVVTHQATLIQNAVRQSKRRLQCCHSPHHTTAIQNTVRQSKRRLQCCLSPCHTIPILNTVRQSKRRLQCCHSPRHTNTEYSPSVEKRLQCCHSPHHTNTEYSPSVEKTTTVLSFTTSHQY